MDDETPPIAGDDRGAPEHPVGPFAATGLQAASEPVVIKKQPAWSYFLTPVSILIGAGIIAGSIWWSTGGDEDDDAVAAMPDPNAVSEAPASASPQAPLGGDSLLSVFTQYATSLGMDGQSFQSCLSKQSNVDLITAQYQRGSGLGVTGTPTFYINNKMVVGSQPAAIFEEIIDLELSGSPTSIDAYSMNIQALANTTPPRFAIADAPPDVTDAYFEGEANAKVIIAEFSDFQCPFCKRWSEETLPALRAKYLAPGQDVSLAFLHYPITQIHPNAGNASVAAICAGEQGKFWEMHDLLFSTQQAWERLQ